jgi:hypothetical protein
MAMAWPCWIVSFEISRPRLLPKKIMEEPWDDVDLSNSRYCRY